MPDATTSALGFLASLQPATPERLPDPQPESTDALLSHPGQPNGPSGLQDGQPNGPSEPQDDRADVDRLLSELGAQGHLIFRRDGKLYVTRASTLTPDLDARLRVHRKLLLEIAHPPEVLIQGVANHDAVQPPSGPTLAAAVVPAPVTSTVISTEGVNPSLEDLKLTPVPQDRHEAPSRDSLPPEDLTTHIDTPLESSPASGGIVSVGSSMADFLGLLPTRRDPEWKAAEPPDLTNVQSIILNFETNGLNWAKGDMPIGVTVGTLDGQLVRFLPWGFAGAGNLDKETVFRFLKSLRGKHITNANTRFDVHMGRNLGVDFEAQGCTVSDIMHYAALLDDHRKRFGLDALAKDYLGGIEVERVDERNMAQYSAATVAARAEYQAKLVSQLREVMWPQLDAQDLQQVRQLEDDVIYPVVEMERNGAKIDVGLLEQMHQQCMSRYQAGMLELCHEVGFAFEHTAAGWQRLFEYCRITPSEKGYSEKVISAINHPTIQKAYHIGEYASLNSKTFAPYLENIDSHGILRFDINQLRGEDGGTVSGRFSIGYVQQVPNHDNHHAAFGDPDTLKSCGGLCDLFPRRLFIPAFGDFFEGDAAQIEYRLFAHFANNAEVLDAYAKDPQMSFHKKMWAMLQQYKPDMLYTHTKSFDFAKQYGAKSIKLAVMMGFITDAEGDEIRAAKRWNDPRLATIQEIEKAFTNAMPEGDYLLERASHLAKSKCDQYCKKGDRLHREFEHRGFVKTICGRRSRYPNNWKTYTGLNRVLQGSGADINKRKIVELHRERKYTGLLMRVTVHDSVLGDAQDGQTTLQRCQEILNAQSFQLKVPILWDCHLGENWARCK